MKSKRPSAKKAAASGKSFSNINREEVMGPDRQEEHLFVPHIGALTSLEGRTESAGDEYSEVLETICGARDDSQPVERYDGTLGVTRAFVAAHQGAACQVQWNSDLASKYTNPGNVSGVRWGSGTMITNDLFLTCGHLFDQTGGGWERPRQNGTTNIISPQDIALNMHLNFNYQVDPSGNLRAEQSFPILQLIEYRLGGIDMAICRIGGSPGSTFGTTAVSATDAATPEMICIIGHPAGQPKRIEAGPTTSVSGNFIRYGDIDTLGGNSGSGILRASDGRLVGVHTNGGCTPASPGDGGTNFGQRITAVIAASPTLRGLNRPVKLKVADDPIVKGTDPVKLKIRDDFKLPIRDLKPLLDTRKGFDVPIPRGGGIPMPTPRPFILSTPHHSTEWQGEAANQLNLEIESALMQYEQAMYGLQQQLQQLEAEYRELITHYQNQHNQG
jgi:V8-like Glu-specific endopeptidase